MHNDSFYVENHCTYATEPNENLKLFQAHLFSVYNVIRTFTYVTKKNRPGEPRILYAFIRTLQGKGIVTTIKGNFELEENSLFLFDVNEIIMYKPEQDKWVYQWYNFTPLSKIPYFKCNTSYIVPFTSKESNINKEIFNLYNDYSNIAFQLTSSIFINLIYNWIHYLETTLTQQNNHSTDIKEIVAFINTHITQTINIDDLANNCYLSSRQFRNIFKANIGISPKQYICNQKLKNVAYMLRTTSFSIKYISEFYNYSSPYQLSTEFKKKYKCSPKEYRHSILNNNKLN